MSTHLATQSALATTTRVQWPRWFAFSLLIWVVSVYAADLGTLAGWLVSLGVARSYLGEARGLGSGLFLLALGLLSGSAGAGLCVGLVSGLLERAYLRRSGVRGRAWALAAALCWPTLMPPILIASAPSGPDPALYEAWKVRLGAMLVCALVATVRLLALRRAVSHPWRLVGPNLAAALLVLGLPFVGTLPTQNPFDPTVRRDPSRLEAPTQLVALGGRVVFLAADPAYNGVDLWASDGTGTGTRRLVDLPNIRRHGPARNPTELEAASGRIWFAQEGEDGWDVWSSEGTASGTMRLTASLAGAGAGWRYPPRSFTTVDNGLLFMGGHSTGVYGLWRAANAPAQATLVRAFPAVNGDPAFPLSAPVVLDGVRYFVAYGADGAALWRSDGTPNGTYEVADVDPQPFERPSLLTVYDGRVYFLVYTLGAGVQLWRSDGTAAGTQQVQTVVPEAQKSASSSPQTLSIVGGQLLFTVGDKANQFQLWHSDGTANGTGPVSDQRFGATGVDRRLVVAGGHAYFRALTPGTGEYCVIWRSDGTEQGTTQVFPRCPSAMMGTAKHLFFVVPGPKDQSWEVWARDGASSDTRKIATLPRINFDDLGPNQLTAVDTTLFFVHGQHLWRSDGTPTGTIDIGDVGAMTP